MENIIVIKSNTRLSDLDKLYSELYESIRKREEISLQIPKSLSRNFFSITTALIQFAATWVQSGYAKKLIVNIQSIDQEQLDRLYEQEFVFPIISLAWNDVLIENIKGKNIRPNLRDYQNNFILKMRRIEAMRKGEKMLLVNLDHFSNSSGLLPYFETNEEFIGKEEDISDSLRDPIMKHVLQYTKSHFQNNIANIYDDIIGIIYELMKNTQEWGKEDAHKVPIL